MGKAMEALKGMVQQMGQNLKQTLPGLDEGRGMGTLAAYGRGGLKDLQDMVLNAFPDSAKAREEPGMVASPTPQIVTAQITGRGLERDM